MSGLAIAPVVVAPITSNVALSALVSFMSFCLSLGCKGTATIVCFPLPVDTMVIALYLLGLGLCYLTGRGAQLASLFLNKLLTRQLAVAYAVVLAMFVSVRAL